MMECWNAVRRDRPSFAEITSVIDKWIRSPETMNDVKTNDLSPIGEFSQHESGSKRLSNTRPSYYGRYIQSKRDGLAVYHQSTDLNGQQKKSMDRLTNKAIK